MFDQFLYSRRLARLQAQRRRLSKAHDREMKDGRRLKKDSEFFEVANQDWWLNDSMFDAEISELQTRYLVDLAQQLQVPLPPSESWVTDSHFGNRYYPTEVSANLRSAIRAEQKERWESRARYIPVLTALTGALGAVIGVLSFVAR